MKITSNNTPLTWDKDNKKFKDEKNYYYDISECPTLTFTDDYNRFSFELQIDGLNVRVKTLHINEECDFEFKDKFMIGIDAYYTTGILNKNDMYIGLSKVEATHTFKSQKKLTKWIRNLIKCKSVA